MKLSDLKALEAGVDAEAYILALCSNAKLMFAVLDAVRDVVKFMEPEWRDDIDRGDADTALVDAWKALEEAP